MEHKDDDFLGDDDLAAFLNGDEGANEEEETFGEEDLFAFLDEEEVKEEGVEEDQDDEGDFGIFGDILSTISKKPQPAMPYKHDKRKARLDITKNSSEDHRTIKRYTKKELEDQLTKDYRYMLGKGHMVIQPVTILADYPYKKKKSDSDIMKARNVDEDYALVIGKLPKWRGTEEFRGKPYKLGHIMYVRKGEYWVDGKIVSMAPHFAIVIHKSYKRISSRRIRYLFKPLKQRLRNSKPFSIYKEFPVLVKRLGVYS